jgi:putative MATE family efflux protein
MERDIMKRDLTTGNVWKNVIVFSLPYLLSYFLQTLYGMADLYIIGQFNGVESTTAVTIGSQVMHMVTVMVVGLAMGATVTIGRAVGAGQSEEAGRAIGNTTTLFLVVSVVLAALLLVLVRPIVSVMSTPSEAVEFTVAYLTICFMGIPFITAYNIISSIFRGLGDSTSPMCFVFVACLINIFLDLVLIGKCGMGAAGAALGTTLSQTCSVLVALAAILRRKSLGVHLKRSDFRPQRGMMGQLLSIGVPIALQDGFVQIAFLVITVIANRRGLNDAAAVGIVEKLIGVIFLVPSSMSAAVSALAAQNIGAGRQGRARQTLWDAMAITVGFGLAISLVMQFAAEPVIGLFTREAVVAAMGTAYMHSYVWDCMFAGMHFCFSGYFCACGRSGLSFLHNSLSIVLVRIPGAYFASKQFVDSLFPMGMAAPAGSLLSVLICVIAYRWLQRHMTEGGFEPSP